MTKRRAQAASGLRRRVVLDLREGSLRNHFAAVHARARSEIDDVIGVAHRLFVMLDDDERISFFAQRAQGLEQPDVVARMQSDGRLVEHVKHAAQIRAELRRQSNALRFAAAQSLRRTPKREVAEPDILHEAKPLLDFRHEIRRDHFLRAAETQLPDQGERFACRTGRELVNCLSLQPHMPRNWVQARAVAFGTGHSFAFIDRLELPLGVQLVLEHRIAGLFVVLLQVSRPRFPRNRRTLRTSHAAN